MSHGLERPGMTWLSRGVASVLICCAFSACASPASPTGPALPKRGSDAFTLYLPRVARAPLPARLYLPRIARQGQFKEFLPAIKKSYPACASLGGDCGEPNGTRGQAFGLSEFNRPYFGTVFTATADVYDYFSTSLMLGKRYTVTLSGGQAPGTPFAGQGDVDLYLYDASGVMLAESAGYGSGAESIVYTPTLSGQYYLLAYAFHTPVAAAVYGLQVRDVP